MTSDFSLLSDLFADTSSRQKFVDNAVAVLQALTSCGCVGIRVLHSDGSLPYQSYSGFSHDFWLTENCLSLQDECVCTRLIKDSVEPIDQAILSAGGSVWTNELQTFAHSIPADLRDCYRGKCVQSEFESLGVIILKGNHEAVGMIHLADTRQGMLPPEKMRAIESLSNVIGAVILRFRIEDELRSAIEIAEQASKAKSEFLANMSHEIRTPMTVTLGALDILKTSRLDQGQSDLVDMAVNSALNLLSLINDILDFSKIEARKVELAEQVCALRPCLEKTVRMFDLEAARKGLDLALEVTPGVPEFGLLDPNRLHQIMTNLLGNAVKFTEHGRITAGIRPDKDGLTFYVEDSGIGIPPDKLDQLFASFTQADASITRKYGGTGLGLAISKGLVELMGATIEVKSREGEGSLFYFTVPWLQFDCAPA
jgi:signal transduction histidine kinase